MNSDKTSKNKLLDKIFTKVSDSFLSSHIKNPALKLAVRIVAWVSLAFFPLLCFVMTEYLHFASKSAFFNFLATRGPVVIFDITLLFSLFGVLLLIFKRAWPACLLLGGFCAAAGIANYLKKITVDEYLYPWDLSQAGNLGLLAGYVDFYIPPLYIALAVIVVLFIVWTVFTRVSIPVRWYIRLPIAAVIILVCVLQIRSPEAVTSLLNRNSLFLEDMAMQNSNYQANGFIGAFSVNVLSNRVERPAGYSQNAVSGTLDGYSGSEESDDFSSPRIILVLSESFWDPRDLPGVKFSENPMENFDELASRDGAVSGRFFTTGFGGGTVRPDFEVLTGLSTDYLPSGSVPYQYVTSDNFPSYVQMLSDLGYHTTSLHPYLPSFYARASAYPRLGFDNVYFTDELEEQADSLGIEIAYRGGQVSDDTFADWIIATMNGGSDFIWGISMENHQPYPDKFSDYGELELSIDFDGFDEETKSAVVNFSQGIADADRALAKLADYVDSCEEDTVLVWFGDHAPTLGAASAAYVQSGLISDSSAVTAEERMITQSTPFIIYSNFELRAGEDYMLHEGEDNQIASYNLMNAVFELIGAPTTPFMELMRDMYAECPYYNVRMSISPSETLAHYVSAHRLITYDRIKGGMYSAGK